MDNLLAAESIAKALRVVGTAVILKRAEELWRRSPRLFLDWIWGR